MSWRYSDFELFRQPTLEEIRSRSEAALKAMRNGELEAHPIAAIGRAIASSWWGREWCVNLERYADFASRIDRGKRYVRSGAVVDLRISAGRADAKVQGSSLYYVEIKISPLAKKRAAEIAKSCASRVENLDALLSGEFPEDMAGLFTGKGGLFPEPRDVKFTCSCPDMARMCKHVAAALYGIAVRFDENPLLFFELRGIEIDSFIDSAIADRVETMLANADCKSARIMDYADLSAIFGL